MSKLLVEKENLISTQRMQGSGPSTWRGSKTLVMGFNIKADGVAGDIDVGIHACKLPADIWDFIKFNGLCPIHRTQQPCLSALVLDLSPPTPTP